VPWCTDGAGCPNYATFFDAGSHPPYGANGNGADWAELWNLVWTYSANGPNNATQIESTLHECSFIYVCPGGTRSCRSNNDCPGGQTCQADSWDQGYSCWADCYNPATGTFDADTNALVTQDFFVASERHDPYGPPW
jgi:hypothetical protein